MRGVRSPAPGFAEAGVADPRVRTLGANGCGSWEWRPSNAFPNRTRFPTGDLARGSYALALSADVVAGSVVRRPLRHDS